MKELKILLNDFLELFSSSLCIVCLLLSGFMIFINLYHYQEIRYKIGNEYALSEEYLNNKNKIKTLKEKVNNIKENTIDTKDYFIYSQTKIKLNACFDSLSESNFYNMNSTTVNVEDIYKYNNDLSGLQHKCLFEVDYAIDKGIKDYKSDIKYDLSADVEESRNNIIFYNEYLKNQLLSNGNYYFSTENSKVSIYNQNLNFYNLTIRNYSTLFEETEKLTNWFLEEFGR